MPLHSFVRQAWNDWRTLIIPSVAIGPTSTRARVESRALRDKASERLKSDVARGDRENGRREREWNLGTSGREKGWPEILAGDIEYVEMRRARVVARGSMLEEVGTSEWHDFALVGADIPQLRKIACVASVGGLDRERGRKSEGLIAGRAVVGVSGSVGGNSTREVEFVAVHAASSVIGRDHVVALGTTPRLAKEEGCEGSSSRDTTKRASFSLSKWS